MRAPMLRHARTIALLISATLSFAFITVAPCACTRGPSTSGTATASGTNATNGAPSGCHPRALGLGDAKPLTHWKPPPPCRVNGGGNSTPAMIRSEEEFHTRFQCQVPSGIDFARDELVVSQRSLSPGGAGFDVVDDGAKVTFVSRFRPPCEGDPHPMPMPWTVTFLLPKDAKRTFGETSCTLTRECP
jgi:hypothetical protein